MNAGYGRQPELKYETAMKAMAEMGYVAVNVGEQDLLLGLDYVRYVADFTGVPLVSANLVDPGGLPAFQEYVIKQVRLEREPVSVGVIGVISTEFKDEIEAANPWLVVEDYGPVLERLVEEVAERADMLILLAHMSDQESRPVAARFPEIDLIIVSHSGDDPYPVAESEADVPIGFAGAKGMHVGVATFTVAGPDTRMDSYFVRALDKELPDSSRMLALLEDYQRMLRVENFLENYPRREYGKAEFVGDKGCLRCHSFSSWRFRKSKHAHAFEPIVEKGHQYDPECVRCHTVGFGYHSGFMTVESTPELVNVGCENCHGPGSLHTDKPMEEAYGEVEQKTCESCHDSENSPKFAYDEYIKKIKHNSFFLCSARICHWLD